MHAAFMSVTFSDGGEAGEMLRQQVIPNTSGTPGFVSGFWAGNFEEGGRGMALLLFENEEEAQTFTDEIPRGSGGGLQKVDDIFIAEVVGQA